MASSSIANTIKAQKQALRKAVTASLRQLTSVELDQQCKMTLDTTLFVDSLSHKAEAISSRLFSLSAFQASNVISCYLSMPSAEARTSIIADYILQSG